MKTSNIIIFYCFFLFMITTSQSHSDVILCTCLLVAIQVFISQMACNALYLSKPGHLYIGRCNESVRADRVMRALAAKNYENKTNMEDASSSSSLQALVLTSQAGSDDSEDELISDVFDANADCKNVCTHYRKTFGIFFGRAS